VPVADPVAVGLNVTPTEQVPAAPIAVPHVLLEIAKGPVIPTLEIVRAVVWRLVSVTVVAELVAPTVTEPKLSVLAESVTGVLLGVPVPLRLTVCGLFGALSVKISVPVAAPVAVGVKVTFTEHFAPALRLAPQVLLETANGPVTAMLAKVNAALWAFVRVTLFAELVLPTAVLPKLRLATESVTGAVPLPLSETVCGLVIALSLKVSVPAAAPTPVGVKVTPTVQFPLAATLAPQVFVAIANGPVATML
jgi:hypothetical protein